jgi:hypothetical protein
VGEEKGGEHLKVWEDVKSLHMLDAATPKADMQQAHLQ